MLSRLLGAFVVLVVGISLVPMIMDSTQTAINSSSMNNSTGFATKEILSMTPYFFAIALVIVAIGVAFTSLKGSGLIGADYDVKDYEEEVKKDPDHKQTYLEYVRERRKAEWIVAHPFLSKIFR